MEKLYQDLVWAFQIMTPPEDYEYECGLYAEWIKKHSRIPARTLLNLGCGAGHHDSHLKKHFQITGSDLSEAMLKEALKLNPEIEYIPGDMRELRLNREFDVVAIFDSIPYMLTREDLRKVFVTAAAHLKPGGVLLVVPDLIKETFVQNATSQIIHSQGNVDLAYIENHYDPDPADTTVEITMLFLIRRDGKLTIETDRHVCGLFPESVWRETLTETGFDIFIETFTDIESGNDYKAFIGVKK
jgi:SAM-dependent methyltransferase